MFNVVYHTVTWPAHDTARLGVAFRRAILRLFVHLDLFDEDQVTDEGEAFPSIGLIFERSW